MIESFIQKRFTAETLKVIEQANEIIEKYDEDDIQLTLRQLYYQFVARNWLPNTDRNYKRLGDVVSDSRLAGLIDWRAIEDLGRQPTHLSYEENVEDFVKQMRDMASAYSLDHWRGQEFYVELHVEKQALSSVLAPIADDWGVVFSMNKGYASQTAFYDASKRFIDAREDGKKCVCIYVGDLDPSGEDMVRDFRDRMEVFGADVEIDKVALTIEQVRKYKCPPNAAKRTDSRFKEFAKKYGKQSWEIDALDPKVLRKIVEKAIEDLVDDEQMAEVQRQEEDERRQIEEALEGIGS